MTAAIVPRARVAYQGAPGAYGEAAIAMHWGAGAEPVPSRTFAALLAAVADGEADFGVVPVWNTTIGAVSEACDALGAAGDRVEWFDEVTVPVRHALLGLPGAAIASLRAVGSHPAALAQCTRFLAAHPHVSPVPAWDTAGAAAELAALARRDSRKTRDATWVGALPDVRLDAIAVVAAAPVAALVGLVVLADGIQDDPRNVTRFAVTRAREAAWRR